MTTKLDSNVDKQSPTAGAGTKCFALWHFSSRLTDLVYTKAATLTWSGEKILSPEEARKYRRLAGNSLTLRDEEIAAGVCARFYASKTQLGIMLGCSRQTVSTICTKLVEEGWFQPANGGNKDVHGCLHYYVVNHKKWSEDKRNKHKCYPEVQRKIRTRKRSKPPDEFMWPGELSKTYRSGLRAEFHRTNDELRQLFVWFQVECPDVESRHIKEQFKMFVRDRRADLTKGMTAVCHSTSKTEQASRQL